MKKTFLILLIQLIVVIAFTQPNTPENPYPESGSGNIYLNEQLIWSCTDPLGEPLNFSLYFSTDLNPIFVAGNLTDTIFAPTALDYHTTYYWKIVAYNIQGDSTIGPIWNFTTRYDFCPDSLLDSRDGQKYALFSVGYQCWMADNLNIGNRIDGGIPSTDNGVMEKYCYGNIPLCCDTMGALYQWGEIMNYAGEESAQGLCPDAWHIPSDMEWCLMEQLIDPTFTCPSSGWRGTDAGLKMKVGGSSGFNGKLVGDLWDNGAFHWINEVAHYWTSTYGGWSNYVAAHSLHHLHDDVEMIYNTAGHGYPVRCKRNNEPPNPPENPFPETGSTNIYFDTQLTWTCTDLTNEPLSYSLYFSTDTDPTFIAGGLTVGSYSPLIDQYFTTYYWRVVAYDVHGDSTMGPIWDFTTRYDFCPDSLTDPRDGQKYATLAIDYQCWMAENINIGNRIDGGIPSADNGVIEKYCYGNIPLCCDTMGALYQWGEVMNYAGEESARGLCPDGWHIPSDMEWCLMEQLIDPSITCPSSGWRGTDAGLKMKVGGSSGFNGKLVGDLWDNGAFHWINEVAHYWTSTYGGWSNYAAAHSLHHLHDDVEMIYNTAGHGYPVRCMKNNEPPSLPENPFPETGSVNIYLDTHIAWSCSETTQEPLSYSLYFGTNTDPEYLAGGLLDTNYTPPALDLYTTYYWKVVAYDIQGDSTIGPIWNFKTRYDFCLDTLTDPRDGQKYGVIANGYQCWMAENLNHGTMVPGGASMSNNAVIEKYCYNDDPVLCDNEQRTFYQWSEAMNYSSGEIIQGICPSGWHLPSAEEWCTMEQNIDPTITCPVSGWHGTDIGIQMKVGGNSGFEAILAGDRWDNGQFALINQSVHYWTTTWGWSNMVYVHGLLSDHDDVDQGYSNWYTGHCVRCVRDNVPPIPPYSPFPDIGSTNIFFNTKLSWLCDDPTYEPLYYSIYLGTGPDPEFIAGGITEESYSPLIDQYFTTYYWKVVAYDVHGDSTMGPIWNFTTRFDFCPDSLTDPRDGQKYATLAIDYQCWMAENLNYGSMLPGTMPSTDNGVVEKYCYNDVPDMCEIEQSTFYQWSEAMKYSGDEEAQGICPNGWHIPSETEWCFLEQLIDATIDCPSSGWRGLDAGLKMKLGGSSGFEGDLTGSRWDDGSFHWLDDWVLYWTSTWGWSNQVSNHGLKSDHDDVFQQYTTAGSGLAVRCIKDNAPPEPPTNPFPETGSVNIYLDTHIAWSCLEATQEPLSYTLYFGTNTDPEYLAGGLLDTNYTPPALDLYTTYYWKIVAYDIQGDSTISPVWNFTTRYDFCPDSLTDSRDGQKYATLAIDYQCWMAESLNYGTMLPGVTSSTDNGIVEKYCYNDVPAMCDDEQSTFYQWNEAMNYSTLEKSQGICPDGWHLPSEEEWCSFEQLIDSSIDCPTTGWHGTDAGIKMKLGGNSGFNGLLAGSRWDNGTFNWLDDWVLYWTSTHTGGNDVSNHGLKFDHDDIFQQSAPLASGLAIRCVKNNEPPEPPGNPFPASGSMDLIDSPTLLWSCLEPERESLLFSLYFGTDEDPPYLQGGISDTLYFPRNLQDGFTYYWKIVAYDVHGDSTVGETWNFSMARMNYSEFLWATQAGNGDNTDESFGVVIDEIGNSYKTGYFTSTAVFGDTTLVGNLQDIFVAKVDPNGEYLWVVQAGSPLEDKGRSIAQDENGDLIVTGYFSGSATFGDNTLVSAGGFDVFVCKLDQNGNFIWSQKAGGADYDIGLDCTSDTDGNIYVSGFFKGTANFGGSGLTSFGSDDVFITKMDSNGNFIWTTQGGGLDEDEAWGIDCDPNGNIYVTGFFTADATFGSSTLTSSGYQDVFVAKLDNDGIFIWTNQAGDSDYDHGFNIATDGAGNSFITGGFMDSIACGNDTLVSIGSEDIFITKLDENGNFIWSRRAGGSEHDRGWGIDTDSLGNLYATGVFQGTSDFGNTTVSSMGGYDIFLSKIDHAGNFIWSQFAQGEDYGYGLDVSVNGLEEVSLCGTFKGTTFFGTDSLVSGEYYDMFVAKIGNIFECVQPLYDSRDDQWYNTVQVGQQCWMSENLNTGTRIDGAIDQTDNETIEKYCYNDDPNNCDTYGGLYEWQEAMAYSTTQDQICPPGWHIPTDGEICTMEQAIDNSINCSSLDWRGIDGGAKLKLGGSSGMDILFAGVHRDDNVWEGEGQFGNFWSQDIEFGTNAWYMGVDIGYTQIFRNSLPEEYALPVRCVFQNNPPNAPENPMPAHGAIDIYPAVELSWTCSDDDLDQLTYNIYIGTDSIPPLLVSGLEEINYTTKFLTPDTIIFWRVVARDIHGAEASSQIWEFRTLPFECGVDSIEYEGLIYGSVVHNNRCWLDRNLGATQVAASSADPASYGYYHQWGRLMDGHQLPTSNTTPTLSGSDIPGHSDFILAPDVPHDWRNSQNDSLWQDVNRTNNPCPGGFYVPSETDWISATSGWSNLTDAFNSSLKLSANGYRSRVTGLFDLMGTNGYYQASSVTGYNHIYMWAGSGAGMYYNGERAGGIAVRCIMENIPLAVPFDPFPPNGSTDRWIADTLKWKCKNVNGDPLKYNIYWGFDTDPSFADEIWHNQYYLNALFPYDTLIYWRVEVTDFRDTVSGPVWSYRTGEYFGEEFEWAKTPTCQYGNYGNDISSDEDGNIYLTGYYGGDISFGTDTLTAIGCYDVYIVKMDNSGNPIWAKSVGGESCEFGYGIAPDNFGNVYVTGTMEGTAYFGSTSLTSYGYKDYFICKLDVNGNFLWADHWGGASGNDYGNDICTDSAGNAYLIGTFFNNSTWGGTNSDEVIVHKYLPDGWREWMQDISSDSDDRGYSICADASGNCYLTGSFKDTIVLNNDTLATHGSGDIFVAKINTDGLWQWAVDAGSADFDMGKSIAMDKYGNIYISGYCKDQAVFGNLTTTGYGSNDIFTAMLDPAGNFKWATKAGGLSSDIGNGICVDDAGGIYTIGNFIIEGTFGDTIVFSSRFHGLFIAKLNSGGFYEWVKTVENTKSIYGNNITVNPDGDLYITGRYQDHALFGSEYLFQKSENAFYSNVINGEMKEVSLHAILQGPYNGSSMSTILNPDHLSLYQPFVAPPWDYYGIEEVLAIPNSEITDWLLIEFRDAPSVETAISGTIVNQRAAFIKSDGTITDYDGSTNIFINEKINYGLYVVIRHRNHLPVISAVSLTETDGVYSYDFTTSASQAYGGEKVMKEVEPGVWALIASDGDANGEIDNKDKNDIWYLQFGNDGYLEGDYDMNGTIDEQDKTIWEPNSGKGAKVPE